MDEHRALSLSRHYARKLVEGEAFSATEYEEYLAYLEWRDTIGRPLLGRFAGQDASTDTVFGRCGLRPPEFSA